MEEKLKELNKAKENVRKMLDDPNILIDFHSIGYWAVVVERLREELREEMF